MGEINCSTWNIRIILRCYWVPVSLKLHPELLRPCLIWSSVPIDIESQSHSRDMGGGGQNFLRRCLSIYINMAIKKYATHRFFDLTATIKQVIHKEFSWSSLLFLAYGRKVSYVPQVYCIIHWAWHLSASIEYFMLNGREGTVNAGDNHVHSGHIWTERVQ